MFEIEIVGVNKWEFADKATGELIKGYTCHYKTPTQNKYFMGYEVGVFKLTADRMGFDPVPGDKCTAYYNNKGKIGSVELI